MITGVSGIGKTTICKRLKILGFKATDIENVNGMFEMYHKGTKKIFEDYDNAKAEHIKNSEWLCDVEKLKKLVMDQNSEIAFYSGIASNMDDILPLFDKVFVLKSNSQILNERLKNREGTNDIGNTQAGRNVVLGWKDWWEGEMSEKGAILINANGSPMEIIEKIMGILGIHKKVLK